MGRYPKIAMLDPFREGVWALKRGDMVFGHVATLVEPVWMPFRKTERVWLLVTWLDEVIERIEEDYEPWTYVTELLNGHFEWEGKGGDNPRLGHYSAHLLVGSEREEMWQQVGIQDDVSAYM